MTQLILTIEHSHVNKKKIMNWLAPIGVNLTLVDNGEDALHVLHKQQPELILFSSKLPETSPKKLIKKLRRHAPMAHLMVIISAADNTLHNPDVVRKVNDFLVEPLCQEEVMFNVAHLLKVQRVTRENCYLKEELAFTAMLTNRHS